MKKKDREKKELSDRAYALLVAAGLFGFLFLYGLAVKMGPRIPWPF